MAGEPLLDEDTVAGLQERLGLHPRLASSPDLDLLEGGLDGEGESRHPILENVVVGARTNALDGILLAATRDHDDGGVHLQLVPDLQRLESVEVRETEVEHENPDFIGYGDAPLPPARRTVKRSRRHSCAYRRRPQDARRLLTPSRGR